MLYAFLVFCSLTFGSNKRIKMNVSPKEETVWLPLNDICLLFDRDKSVISRHIKTVIMENDLDEKRVVAKNATTANRSIILIDAYADMRALDF